MKANRQQVEQALKTRSGPRIFLLYGPDEAGSRSFLPILAAGMGHNAERIDLSGHELKADPARLADEAAAISLFGTSRFIVVEPAGDEATAAVEALLEAPAADAPVMLIAGALKPASRLLKLALADPTILALASYVPEGRDADRLVLDMAKEVGLSMRPDLARRIAEAAGGNRAVVAQELAKLALFVDAAPERPKQVDFDAVDAIGAASDEGDLGRLVESVGNGDQATLEAELLRLSSQGIEGIPLIRAVLRRMFLLARLRAEVERGNSVASVMASHGKAVFWKEKDAVTAQLSRWRSHLIAKSVSRLLEAERQVKAAGALGTLAVDQELFAVCRQAARLR
ncbi:MAG TPA: DNA polymerase III subunit delta [Allosphingosinicella sp.]|nr:DNA polymerase III subunit delta [Allosphingosinicella sp.]